MSIHHHGPRAYDVTSKSGERWRVVWTRAWTRHQFFTVNDCGNGKQYVIHIARRDDALLRSTFCRGQQIDAVVFPGIYCAQSPKPESLIAISDDELIQWDRRLCTRCLKLESSYVAVRHGY